MYEKIRKDKKIDYYIAKMCFFLYNIVVVRKKL